MIADHQYGALLAGDRQTYRLDEKVGEGGEGTVYRVDGRPDLVAKIYHDFDYLREEKLDHLVGIANKRLLKIAAWPLSELRDAENKVVGFVMPRLHHWQPLHTVYNVRQRLQNHPDRTWKFLVRAARNLAVCIHQVHDVGLVVGDLNESNVLVDSKAMVKLIDVDSFQAKVGDRLHGCFVGRPELLAPELQGGSLQGVERTPEHDRFALAVLVFQLLAFGRHPFAGRQEDDEDRTLENSIRQGHYAYSKLRPGPLKPPRLAELGYLPSSIQDLFEKAFDPASPSRPDAGEWFVALRALEHDLKVCPDNDKHRYWNGSERCPWCRVEDEGGLSLFPARFSPSELQVPADALWEKVEPVIKKFDSSPPPFWLDYQSLEPESLGRYEKWLGRASFSTIFGVFVTQLAIRAFNQKGFGIFLLGTMFMALLLVAMASPLIRNEFRKHRLKKIIEEQNKLYFKYEKVASNRAFDIEVQKLEAKRDLLTHFEAATETERQEMIRAKYSKQLEAFLKKYSTLAADIGQFGREQVGSLYEFGIKTAADITDEKMAKWEEGYPKAVAGLKEWRAKLVKQFWATGSFQLSVLEEQNLHRRMYKRAQEAKRDLTEAPEKLEDLMTEMQIHRLDLLEELHPLQETIRELGPRVRAFEILNPNTAIENHKPDLTQKA